MVRSIDVRWAMWIKVSAIAVMAVFAPSSLFAWDGYDTETGESVSIEKGNLVRSGREIEIYDEAEGEYRTVTVEDINDIGGSVEIETYDYETGEYRTFEMED